MGTTPPPPLSCIIIILLTPRKNDEDVEIPSRFPIFEFSVSRPPQRNPCSKKAFEKGAKSQERSRRRRRPRRSQAEPCLTRKCALPGSSSRRDSAKSPAGEKPQEEKEGRGRGGVAATARRKGRAGKSEPPRRAAACRGTSRGLLRLPPPPPPRGCLSQPLPPLSVVRLVVAGPFV